MLDLCEYEDAYQALAAAIAQARRAYDERSRIVHGPIRTAFSGLPEATRLTARRKLREQTFVLTGPHLKNTRAQCHKAYDALQAAWNMLHEGRALSGFYRQGSQSRTADPPATPQTPQDTPEEPQG